MGSWVRRAAGVVAGIGLAALVDRERAALVDRERSAEADPLPDASAPAPAPAAAPRRVMEFREVGTRPRRGWAEWLRQRAVDAGAVVVRAVRDGMRANITDRAAGLAYYGFLAVPSLLIVALGVAGLVIDPDRVGELVDRLAAFAPESAVQLLQDVLDRVAGSSGSSAGLIAVGLLFALWSATGAATALMRGLNEAHDRSESRGTVTKRLVALAIVGWLLLAVVIAIGVIALGPVIAARIGDTLGNAGLVEAIWAGLQWPLAILGLMLALAGILSVGPDVAQPRWRLVVPGAVFATAVWLLTSGLFSVYVSNFGSYDAAWGSLSAVIVLLTWIWLSALAILLGARVNAEVALARAPGRAAPGARAGR